MRFSNAFVLFLVAGVVTPFYGELTGLPRTDGNWVIVTIMWMIALHYFSRGSQIAENAANRGETIWGAGIMISIFSGLLLPVVLHFGGLPLSGRLALLHEYRFVLGVVLAGALLVGAIIVEAGSAIEEGVRASDS